MGLLRALSEDPRSFTWLRKVAELNFTAVRRVVRRELEMATAGPILDLGCGTGELSPLFRPDRYLGVDLSRRYLSYARRRFPGRPFAACDAAALPLRPSSCPAVLIFGVLHHMEEEPARASAKEAARVLATGGKLLLIEDSRTTPSWNLPGRLMHAIDAGENIRDRDGYRLLFAGTGLAEIRSFRFRSGICDYEALLFERPDSASRSR